MDRRLFFALPALLILFVLALAAWFIHRERSTPASSVTPTASSTMKDLRGQSIYTNGEYGFAIVYPAASAVETSFASFYHLRDLWRAYANPDATGTPIAAIVVKRISNSSSYPRYFDAEVRIGASRDPKEMASCRTAADGETALPDAVINGATWKAFSFEDAGMMQYAKGVSYRTVHDGACIALEKVEAGSSYREGPPGAGEATDKELSSYYASLDSIIQSFSFARP